VLRSYFLTAHHVALSPSRWADWADRAPPNSEAIRRQAIFSVGPLRLRGLDAQLPLVRGLPPSLIEYLVVHELVHQVAPQHDERFWSPVERVLPDCRNGPACSRTQSRPPPSTMWPGPQDHSRRSRIDSAAFAGLAALQGTSSWP